MLAIWIGVLSTSDHSYESCSHCCRNDQRWTRVCVVFRDSLLDRRYFSDTGTGMTDNRAWAGLAATVAAVVGLLMGLPLGFFIGLLNGRLVVGTVLGFIGGVFFDCGPPGPWSIKSRYLFSDCLFRLFYSGRRVKWIPGFADYFAVRIK